MAIKSIQQLSGKRKRRAVERLDSDRYTFLEISQAEPSPGNPDSDNALFTSLADGTRSFTTIPTLSGLNFKANSLDSAIGSQFLLALSGNPTDGFADSVGLLSLTDLPPSTETLQSVTERGSTTTVGLDIAQLSADSTTIAGDLQFSGFLLDASSRSLIIYDSADNILWGS
tara:strand:- start:3517 stop:4029 length:513 start_codon:yes stop_codon:yes gene_type:complete